jgi:hypothetical protein
VAERAGLDVRAEPAGEPDVLRGVSRRPCRQALSLALARAEKGEYDGVVEPIRPVLALAPEQRISGFSKAMDLIHRAMNGGPQQAQEIQEEIEIFTRVRLPSFPV